MKLDELKPAEGSKKDTKRLGRGPGSGWGRTSGRGEKGAGQRAGNKKRAWFEGGQMPLLRRLPKKGFGSEVVYRMNVKRLSCGFVGSISVA